MHDNYTTIHPQLLILEVLPTSNVMCSATWEIEANRTFVAFIRCWFPGRLIASSLCGTGVAIVKSTERIHQQDLQLQGLPAIPKCPQPFLDPRRRLASSVSLGVGVNSGSTWLIVIVS